MFGSTSKLLLVLFCLCLTVTVLTAVEDEAERRDDEALVPHVRRKRAFFLIFPIILLGAAKTAAGAALQAALKQAAMGKTMIRVHNYVGADIVVECKSADDTIGPKTLKKGEGIAFTFKPQIFGRTHFWCNVWWGRRRKYFPAYGEGAPRRSMNYDVRTDGFYRDGKKFADW